MHLIAIKCVGVNSTLLQDLHTLWYSDRECHNMNFASPHSVVQFPLLDIHFQTNAYHLLLPYESYVNCDSVTNPCNSLPGWKEEPLCHNIIAFVAIGSIVGTSCCLILCHIEIDGDLLRHVKTWYHLRISSRRQIPHMQVVGHLYKLERAMVQVCYPEALPIVLGE